jgi:uncharacterized MAPEG superfamily protein
VTVTTEEYTRQLLKETREEIVRADTKITTLFASYGVVVVAVLAGIIGGDWKPADLADGATEVFIGGAAFAAVAFSALIVGLWPKTTHKHETGPANYFGDVLAYKNKPDDQLKTALELGARSNNRERKQLVIVSGIVQRKYTAVQVAIVTFAIALALCCGAVIFGQTDHKKPDGPQTKTTATQRGG